MSTNKDKNKVNNYTTENLSLIELTIELKDMWWSDVMWEYFFPSSKKNQENRRQEFDNENSNRTAAISLRYIISIQISDGPSSTEKSKLFSFGGVVQSSFYNYCELASISSFLFIIRA